MSEQSTGTEQVRHAGATPVGEIPVLKSKEKLQVEQPVPGFVAAYSALALTPDAIGQFGAKLAQNSAQTLAKIRGTESGKDPHGDLLPAITDVDKVYGDAYSAQSQATLGLQAQSMLNKGQEELDQAYKLSPSMLGIFNKNMSEGMNDILKNSPSSVKSILQNQFANSLLNTSHNYNEKLISQNKEQAKATATAYSAAQARTIFDSQFTDNPEVGAQIYQDMKSVNAKNRAVGMITPAQETADNKKNELLLLSGKYNAAAQTALKTGKLPEFLHDFNQNKVPSPNKGQSSIGESDKEALGKQILSFVSQQEAFESRDQQLLLSQGKLANLEGIGAQYLDQFKTEMWPNNFNNWYSDFIKGNNTQTTAKKISEALDHSWSNIEDWNRFSGGDVDKKYYELQDNAIKKNPNITPMQAKLGTAIAAAGSIPAFNKELDNGMSSGNAQQMLDYGNAYREMHNIDATKVAGVSAETMAINHAFHNMLDRGVPADVAAQQAREAITQRTPEQKKNIDENWKDYHQKNLSTADQRQQFARSLMSGYSRWPYMSENIPMESAVRAQILQAFEENFRIAGDPTVAKQVTEGQVKATYGITEINGVKEWVYMPPEQLVKLDAKAVPLMHNEMKDQLAAQFAYGKEAFDKGFVSTYYRLAPNENGKPPKVFEVHRGTIQPFESKGLVEKGNIDLLSRPYVKNKDGSVSTVDSLGVEMDGKQYLIPKVSQDGKHLDDAEAIELFKKTKEHLGIFSSAKDSTEYAKYLHLQQAEMVANSREFTVNVVTAPSQSVFGDPDNPSLSAYDISLKNDKGVVRSFFNTVFENGIPPYYRPNINSLKKAYADSEALNGDTLNFHDAAQEVMKQHKENRANTPDAKLARMRATLDAMDAKGAK